MATTVTKTVAELAVEKSFTNGAVCTPFNLDDVIAVSTSATDANSGKYYSNGEQIRLYQTGAATMTLTAAEGYKISSVTVTYASQNTGIFTEAASGEAVAFDNVQSATFTVGNSGTATNGQVRITEFTVVYDAAGETPVTPVETMDYYVVGSMTNWGPQAAYKLAAATDGTYTGEFTFAANDEFKVAYSNGTAIEDANWFPTGMGNNYTITEAGDYTITFNPAGNVEGWYAGYFQVAMKEVPVLADPTNCAEAREAALSVSANNVPYKDSTIYAISGYVTEIKTAYSDQYHNITFWMADAADGGQVIQAYRAACASAEDAPIVGDKVTVTGALSKYNSTPQFMAGSTFVITEHATPAVPQNLGEKTIAEFLALANTVDTCVITGVVANIKKNSDGSYNKYGNFDLVDGEASVYVYGLLTADGEAQKFQEMGVDEGDTLTVKAVYSLYNNNVQAKNAIFVAVKKAAVTPIEPTEITIDIETEVNFIDYVASAGWWQFLAENDEYEISISNVSTTQAAGTYTVDDLDADYSYITIKATNTDVTFEECSLVLTEGENGSRTIEGTVRGSDGNTYNIKLVFVVPTAQTTVNVEIPEWEVYDGADYYGFASVIFMGQAEDSTYVQFALYGNDVIGDFTYDDCYNGGIEVAGEWKSPYSMDIHINVSDANRAIITMDILCLNNTLYHVTTTIGEGFENVDAAVKAIKKMVNGNVIIEKNGVKYTVNGARL